METCTSTAFRTNLRSYAVKCRIGQLTILLGAHRNGRGGGPLATLRPCSQPDVVEGIGVESVQGIRLRVGNAPERGAHMVVNCSMYACVWGFGFHRPDFGVNSETKDSLVMGLIGVCVIPVELVVHDILAGMRRLGPLQCDCGLADIGCPEIARLRWYTFVDISVFHIPGGFRCYFGWFWVSRVWCALFAGWELHLVFGLVIMKRKLRKLNKIQTNQCGAFVCMPMDPSDSDSNSECCLILMR